MTELRILRKWSFKGIKVEKTDVLQYRKQELLIGRGMSEMSGYFWSEWIDVPIVEEE